MPKRCVIITGAAGGIGQALSARFASAGYSVIGVDRTEPPSIEGNGHCFVECDLARLVDDPPYAGIVIGHVRSACSAHQVAGLINNAAVQLLGAAETLDRDVWRTTLNVNLIAPFLLTQAFAPDLESAGGSVLNISSIHARLTKPGFVAYATSKAALSGMTRALAVEYGERIRVNAIEPAAIATPMLVAGFGSAHEKLEQLKRCHPQARIGEAKEVANLALAIIDGCIDFLHGSVIGLDGGISGRLFDPA